MECSTSLRCRGRLPANPSPFRTFVAILAVLVVYTLNIASEAWAPWANSVSSAERHLKARSCHFCLECPCAQRGQASREYRRHVGPRRWHRGQWQCLHGECLVDLQTGATAGPSRHLQHSDHMLCDTCLVHLEDCPPQPARHLPGRLSAMDRLVEKGHYEEHEAQTGPHFWRPSDHQADWVVDHWAFCARVGRSPCVLKALGSRS